MNLHSFFSKCSKLFSSSTNDNSKIDYALLPPTPVWSRIFIWTLSLGSILTLVWSIVVKIDERVVFTGEITTSRPAVTVSVDDPGVITKILTQPHQFVRKGDLLLVYDDYESVLRLNSINKQIQILIDRRQSDFILYDLRARQFEEQIELDADLLKRLELLHVSGSVEETQVIKQRAQLSKVRIQLSTVDEERRRSEFQFNQTLEELSSTASELQSRINHFTVRSPVSGFIQQMKYQTVGERIQPRDSIFSIIPKRDLIARVNIPSTLQAPVNRNAEAKVSVDAFPVS